MVAMLHWASLDAFDKISALGPFFFSIKRCFAISHRFLDVLNHENTIKNNGFLMILGSAKRRKMDPKSLKMGPWGAFATIFFDFWRLWKGSFFRWFSGSKKVGPKTRKIWEKWSPGVAESNRNRRGRGQGGGKGGGKPPPRLRGLGGSEV